MSYMTFEEYFTSRDLRLGHQTSKADNEETSKRREVMKRREPHRAGAKKERPALRQRGVK
jgi:hypothetical protein